MKRVNDGRGWPSRRVVALEDFPDLHFTFISVQIHSSRPPADAHLIIPVASSLLARVF